MKNWHLNDRMTLAHRPTPSGALLFVMSCTLSRWGHIWLAYRTDRTGD